MSLFEFIQAAASILTMVGVGLAARQLALTKQQSVLQFEEGLNERYRAISQKIPLEALLGATLPDAVLDEHLRAFYNYFDLSNEQAFLASRGRLQPDTWANWKEGVEQHLQRPAFRQAWERLAPRLDGSFDHVRAMVAKAPGLSVPTTAPAA